METTPKLKDKTTTLAKTQTLISSISHYNSLTAYPIADEQFVFWAKIIERARPHTQPEEIRDVIIRLAMGIEIQVDTRLGVQNILKHLFTEEEKAEQEYQKILQSIKSNENE